AHVLNAIFVDDRGTRRMHIAKRSGKTGRIVQRLEQIFGKRGHCAREIMPVLRQRVSGEFPMARGRVLALRLLGRTRVEALRRAGYFQPWWNAMCGKAARLAQTQSREIS